MKLLSFMALAFGLITSSAHAQSALKKMNSEEFNRYIRDENRGLVILLPTATWCAPCRNLHPEYEKAADDLKSIKIDDHTEDFSVTLIQMDYDQNKNFMDSLRIDALPQTEVYFNGARRWEYKGGIHELRMVFEARQALEAAVNGTFKIKNYTLFVPVQ